MESSVNVVLKTETYKALLQILRAIAKTADGQEVDIDDEALGNAIEELVTYVS